MMRVGIPRALLYYQYLPMWETFFQRMGAEVVVSSATTKEVLSSGSSRVVAETCLPVKVFCGHVISLIGKCDYMFIPAIRSVDKRVYNCSKFLGLPDMTRAVIPECPPILDMDIDVTKGKHELYQSIYKLGRHFTWNPMKVKEAAEAAWQAHLAYLQEMRTLRLTPLEAMRRRLSPPEEGPRVKEKDHTPPWATIALIGHPYLIYDEYVNHRLITRLQRMGIRVLTPEMVSKDEIDAAIAKLVGQPYWTYEEEVVGAGGHYLESGADGVIGALAFGCGPDSVMMDMVQRHAKKHRATPFMSITIDEHTAEAGMVTRLEAFLDMIQRRKRDKVKICA